MRRDVVTNEDVDKLPPLKKILEDVDPFDDFIEDEEELDEVEQSRQEAIDAKYDSLPESEDEY